MKLLVVALTLGACAPDVPSTPSYQADVQPILAASCIRCHGVPAIGGAPESLRLDTYADLAGIGAASFRGSIVARVSDEARPMPPRFPLGDWEIDVLQRWVDTGGGRGDPRPDNHPPTATLVTRDAGVLTIDVEDADGDVVGGALLVDGVVVGPVASGRTTVTAPAGNILRVQLDDGAAVIELELP